MAKAQESTVKEGVLGVWGASLLWRGLGFPSHSSSHPRKRPLDVVLLRPKAAGGCAFSHSLRHPKQGSGSPQESKHHLPGCRCPPRLPQVQGICNRAWQTPYPTASTILPHRLSAVLPPGYQWVTPISPCVSPPGISETPKAHFGPQICLLLGDISLLQLTGR